jgi:lipoate-protein ligase A
MTAPLEALPVTSAATRENMALDWALLEAWPRPDAIRFRHYDWSDAHPATFGLSQSYGWARELAGPEASLSRRPTGGGLVDHREDWTYALVIPPTHPACRLPAPDSYRELHDAVAGALREIGLEAAVYTEPSVDPGLGSLQCFVHPARFDVMHPGSGQKLAGAAQKRNRHGLLFQGSIDGRPIRDRGAFRDVFIERLCRWLSAESLTANEVRWTAREAELREQTEAESWQRRR